MDGELRSESRSGGVVRVVAEAIWRDLPREACHGAIVWIEHYI